MTTARDAAPSIDNTEHRPSPGPGRDFLEFVERVEDLSLFQDRIAMPKGMPQVWEALREEIERLVTPTAQALFLVDPDTRAFELNQWTPTGDKSICQLEIDAQIECGTFAWIVNRRRPAVIPSLVFRGPQNLVMLPLTTQSRTLGVTMIVTAIEEKTITHERLRLLGILSKQCALVMENTLLYDELKAEHEALRAAQAQIIQAEKFASLGRLTSGAFHELLNPLNVISGHLQLMRMADAFTAPWTDYLGVMKDASDRIAAIVNSLLRFSPKRQQNRRPVDLEGLLNDAVAAAAARRTEARVAAAVSIQEGLPPVSTSAADLKTVLGHLIDNAYDAMPEGGTLSVAVGLSPTASAAHAAPAFLEITVTDNGRGIRETDIHKVFDPFFTTKDVGDGTGLGLAVSYALVRSMGGTLTFDSRPNKGSVFTVRLPLPAAEQEGER